MVIKGFNKKGTTMVEAAVVFPLVILVAVSIVFILTFMFNQVAINSRLHLGLTSHMGQETKTYYTYRNVPSGVRPISDHKVLGECYWAEASVPFNGKWILNKSFIKPVESSIYKIDERKLIRYVDFFKE